MSLRGITEKIDNVLFGAVAVLCLVIWATLGFPLAIELFSTAALIVAVYVALRWMESRH